MSTNVLFTKELMMKKDLITIGESVHASIPRTAEMMKQLSQLGSDAYLKPSEPLDYIKNLIQSQAKNGASYIAVNLDAFGESDMNITTNMMVEYVELVRRFSNGVPICIDSSNDEVLIAGLKKWYDTNESVKPPLINSVKVFTMDKIFPLKADYNYSFIGLLVGDSKPIGPGGASSVDELCLLAKRIFATAVGKYDFEPEEIFFDSTVFPLAIDMPFEPGVPGYTYRAFETVKKIKNDPTMKGVHFSFGISNCSRELPARKIGICRAYVAKAMEYGLDAAIVNVAHNFGKVEPDTELLKLVNAYAEMDGSAEKTNRAMELMAKFCQKNRK
ncbi:MAG: dihydropteroate synthase [Planctomycetes bacterium]|nr:dihydropteroate synthase [Planctomycetota bacterium]